MKSAQVKIHIEMNGKKFIISSSVRPCGKVGWYAHELGEKTQFAKLFGGDEVKAYRVNDMMRVKGMKWITRPFESMAHALVMAHIYSEKNIRHV